MSRRQSGLLKKEAGYVGCKNVLDGKHGKRHVHGAVRIPFGVPLESSHSPAPLFQCKLSFVSNSGRGQSVRF